uniref:PDZ domain-containing protein n=1 Tax=Ascaris lumbricoides TaxID=6252 RepID=A0A0M3II26_ASCLU
MGPENFFINGLYYPPSCSLKSYRSTSSLNRIFTIEPCLLEEFIIAIKSKFGVDMRRISLRLGGGRPMPTFEEFYALIRNLHQLVGEFSCDVSICYVSREGDRLPISNDENLRKALEIKSKILRLTIQKRGESLEEQYGYGIQSTSISKKKKKFTISNPQDFRRVSSIVDADILPQEYRRVKLCKYYNNKPLGFYIRDGMTKNLTPRGIMPMKGIFVSRLVENGLAASTNLLAINDEIIEVNGIEVAGKSLDQVTDMMIANAANLILTVKPAIQPYTRSNIQPSFLAPTNYATILPPIVSQRSPLLPPVRSFSRTSTWRLSEKIRLPSLRSTLSRDSSSKSSLSQNTSRRNTTKKARRPMSVHFGAISLISPKSKNITVF